MSALEHSYHGAILKVDSVNLSFDGVRILRDVNVEIKDVIRPGKTQGQVVGLLGPSGVGKTCLFRILAGLMDPDSGRVLVDEAQRPVQRGMVGVVAQNYPLFSHRTVMGNLLVAGKQSGLTGTAARDKANSLLDRFVLKEHASKYPTQLSGGQRQRVAIVQQFMCSENFLLMDEPFSGLDLVALNRVIGLITEMAESDELKTFIVVTHDIAAALEVCDTIWLMGRERDAKGSVIPGARIVGTYDLIERGLAWREGVADLPEFAEIMREIRAIFPKL